jgi:hypothetical protein
VPLLCCYCIPWMWRVLAWQQTSWCREPNQGSFLVSIIATDVCTLFNTLSNLVCGCMYASGVFDSMFKSFKDVSNYLVLLPDVSPLSANLTVCAASVGRNCAPIQGLRCVCLWSHGIQSTLSRYLTMPASQHCESYSPFLFPTYLW